MVEMKKNAKLGIIGRIKQKLGIILPIMLLLITISTIAVFIAYFVKTSQLNALTEQEENLKSKIQTYESQKNELLAYAEKKEVYNDYFNSVLNFPLIFKTIENYIPSESMRNSLNINNNNSVISTSVNAEIEGYEDYMSFLRLVDKCSFVSEEQKRSLLNISSVELGGENNDTLGETISVNIGFNFSTVENEYVLLKKYEQALTQMSDLGKFINFIDISKGYEPDNFQENKDYSENLKRFYTEKENFSENIASILDRDSNGLYINNTGENFISNIRKENEFLEELIEHYNGYKNDLSQKIVQINNSGDIFYNNPNNETRELVLNLEEEYNNYLLEINQKILDLEIVKRYNNYLLDNNYLDTFTNLKDKNENFTINQNGERIELNTDEYITYIINNYEIISEDDPLLINTVKQTEKSLNENGESVFNEINTTTLNENITQKYNEYISKIKNIDEEKEEILSLEKYIDNFYDEYITYNGYIEELRILDFFFNETLMDTSFLNGIQYSFLDFSVRDNLNTYKKRFLLTIENNKLLSQGINKINSKDKMINEIRNVEDFLKKTDDMIKYKNNNINCITKDIKTETTEIYEEILEDRQNQQEQEQNIQEIDIIIEAYES